MEQSAELQGFIPGLPDDIVLNHIATRIPWSSMYPLTWVNQRWRRAIRSRQVYDTRKHNGMSQSMFVASMQARTPVTRNSELDRLPVPGPLASERVVRREWWSHMHAGLYDVENGDSYMFPSEGDRHVAALRPPGFQTTASVECGAQGADGLSDALELHPNLHPRLQGKIHVPGGRAYKREGMVILDGKVYAMQAFFPKEGGQAEKVVQVLDIGACDWEWRLCSTPDRCPYPSPYQGNDDCPISWAVCNGKFYCFHTCNTRLHGEVFDPKTNTWREIEDRPVNPSLLPRNFPRIQAKMRIRHHPRLLVLNEEIHMAYRWEAKIMIFNSATEKWRLNTTIVIPGDMDRANLSFTAYSSMIVVNGKLYNFVGDFVLFYNPESSSWTELQRTLHKDFVEEAKQVREMLVVAFYDNEVVAMLESGYYSSFPDGTHRKFCKSVGFGVEGEAMIWEEFPRSCFKNCLYTEQNSRGYTYAEGFWDLRTDIILDYLEL